MEALISKASELARQSQNPFVAIPNRIAYVVSAGQSDTSKGYAIRTQDVAQALSEHGFEVLCFALPGHSRNLDNKGAVNGSIKPETLVEDVRYVHGRWRAGEAPTSESEHLQHSIARYIELFLVYRPAAVLVASDYIAGLPAWVAATRLGLPFYNEVRDLGDLRDAARELNYAGTPEGEVANERDTFVARQARKVFTLNQVMKADLVKRGIDPAGIEIVPDQADRAALKNSVTPLVDAFHEVSSQPVQAPHVVPAPTQSVSTAGQSPFEAMTSSEGFELPVKDPTWFTVTVQPGQRIVIKCAVNCEINRGDPARKAVLILKTIGREGQELSKPCGKLAKSGHFNAFFKYLPHTDAHPEKQHEFIVPAAVVQLKIGVCGFNLGPQERVIISDFTADEPVAPTVAATPDVKKEQTRPAVEVEQGAQRRNPKSRGPLNKSFGSVSRLGAAIASSIGIKQGIRQKPEQPVKPLAKLRVAGIMDEFTLECFRHEVQLSAITPDNWEAELASCDADFLFVESCWFGNGNQWSGLMFGYTSNGPNKMDKLIDVIAYCRKKGIPTVFWAKEDPVHYERFGPTAELFDYVYTTDANMVPAYRQDFGIDAQPLSFFCQPRVHNPNPVITRNNKAAFAGSYYSNKIERCENFHTVMQGLEQAGVDYDIFDRCLKRGVAHLQFPEHFKKHVVGYLEPHEMWKAYKGYRFTVNLNTVKHSPTMFARRVYESLASGTPVISNYSEGVITQFGGIVCASDNQQDIVDYLNRLKDPKEYQAISEWGAREALGRHTLADRLEQICERLGIPVIPHLPIANAVYTAGTESEVERARADFHKQGYHRKRLVVNLENSNVLYPYLNRNSEEEIFRVITEFAKPLQGVEVPMSLDSRYSGTHLEDAAIRTQYQDAQAVTRLKEAAV